VLAGTKMKIDEIYIAIKEAERALKPQLPKWRKEYFNKVFKSQLSPKQFKALLEANQCYYCEITLDEIFELIKNKKIYKKNERGWKMEIDRKDPNQEYSDANCVPSCYWCNNAKTDEFNEQEFKLIGLAIGETLRARLKK
jgi:5-methylcytosine-specific restriction endonuclease McrA